MLSLPPHVPHTIQRVKGDQSPGFGARGVHEALRGRNALCTGSCRGDAAEKKTQKRVSAPLLGGLMATEMSPTPLAASEEILKYPVPFSSVENRFSRKTPVASQLVPGPRWGRQDDFGDTAHP